MQRLISAIILSFLFGGLYAQVRNKKTNAANNKQNATELIEKYKFEEASALINKELQTARRKQQNTDSLENLLGIANHGQDMLSSTEKVVFIDSVIVDKDKILDAYRISSESGKIGYLKHLLKSEKNATAKGNSIAYTPQLFDKIYYSTNKGDNMYLFTRDRLDDKWGEAKQVKGLEDFGYDQITPFVLTDGFTLYFSAKGEESIGGYDIFVAQYSQEQGCFLKPENIGMPFNSPSNDYLYVIDETNNLGWFASDRCQPEGKVCVYVFIPNDTRTNYGAETDDETLINYAKISSIKATWHGKDKDVKNAISRLKNVFSEKKSTQRGKDFSFVINDTKTYTSLDDFKQPQARNYASKWQEAKKTLEIKKTNLSTERDNYAKAASGEKEKMATNILKAEKETEELSAEIAKLEKAIREEELKK